MHALPGGDSWLYTMIRTHLGLRNRREVFVLGLRLIHAVGPDPVLRLILLNVASEVLVTDLDHLDWRPKDEPPHDEPFPSGIARVPCLVKKFNRTLSAALTVRALLRHTADYPPAVWGICQEVVARFAALTLDRATWSMDSRRSPLPSRMPRRCHARRDDAAG